MKSLLFIFFSCLCFSFTAKSQNIPVEKLPEYVLPSSETEAHLRFISSDELQGRMTGEIGSKVAARYIAEQFRLFGIQPVKNQVTFYQNIIFSKKEKGATGKLIVGTDTLTVGKNVALMGGDNTDIHDAPLVFLNYGWTDEKGYDDYKNTDVRGKIVVALWGTPDTTIGKNVNAQFGASFKKEMMAQKKGALALVEILSAATSFKRILRFTGGGGMSLKEEITTKLDKLPHCVVDSMFQQKLGNLDQKTMTLITKPATEKLLISPNVVGVIEGTDAILKKQYIILSAHYDHLGMIAKDPQKPDSQDTIYNGARDNGFGCSALLLAAKSLSISPPRRSVIFIAFTGEEVGLLGSNFYANHPLVPLKECVYALDTDGAGYNDTTVVTTIGLNRTDCQAEIEKGAAAFGLKVIDDPAPEQNLFDRSDNVSFAAKGIPSPDFGPGLTKFDKEILKYYHQLGDEVETVNLRYFHKYCQSFVYTARLIANRNKKPQWRAGDKYEKAYNLLYETK